jgi:uncharacterized membrane protein
VNPEPRGGVAVRALLASLLEDGNRGLLLDVVVFSFNLAGMALLMGFFADVVRRAAADDPGAMAILLACAVALFVLAPIGATLKRWHHHQRRGGAPAADPMEGAGGCLFSPIFYFSLAAVIFATVNAFVMQQVYGRREPDGTVFVTSIFVGLGLIITHTVLVYRYFSPPARPPRSAFMRGRASAILGDACLFANMLLFQVAWNALSFAGIGPPGGVVDALLRLCVLLFLALLIYFPPRMFYLAEDIGRPRTWLMILLANAPVITRLLLGTSGG